MATFWLPLARILGIALLSWCVSGCARNAIVGLADYTPVVRAAQEPNVAVALRIEDARHLEPPDRDSAAIGTLQGELGVSTELRLGDPGTIKYFLRAATKDALRMARVTVSSRAPRTLIVRVDRFWCDVPSRQGAVVAAQLALQDEHGVTLWKNCVAGNAGGLVFGDFPSSFLRGIYQRALTSYTQAAIQSFQSRDFQRQLY